MYRKIDSFHKLSRKYIKDKYVFEGAKSMLIYLDSIDPVKALHIIRDLEALLERKLDEIEQQFEEELLQMEQSA